MSQNLIFADPKVQEEFIDRFKELTASGSGGLEGLDVLPYSTDDAQRAIKTMQESTDEPIDAGLEAIILRFGRPAFFVQNDTFDTTKAPSSSAEVNNIVNQAKSTIERAIPSVGRINLRDHRMSWVGTGWMVADNVLVTNRHVAREFAEREGDGFVFIETSGRTARAYLDTVREHQVSKLIVYRLREVLWIAPSSSHDVAFLSIDAKSEDNDDQPPPIALMDATTFNNTRVEEWTAVIGYPAFSRSNDRQDQQRIFEGVFNVKRLQPGKITAKANAAVKHDATTLGGNSGSVVLHLNSGKAVALHWGGLEGRYNSAVAAPVVADLLRQHVL